MNPPRTLELWPKDCPHHCEQPHGLPRIDIHIPPADAPARTRGGTGRPILLVCPGGGYQGNAEHEGTPIARLAAAHGIVGAVCWYRVAPHGWPAGYADAARAIRLLRSMSAELRADPHRLALMGFSAGGHNVCMLATDPDEHLDPRDDLADRHAAAPDRLILGYAVTSFVHDAHIGSMRNLLGDRADAHAVRKHYSAECRVTEHTPPTFLFHPDRDPSVVPSKGGRVTLTR